MRLEYVLTLQDFKAARALHRRQRLSRRLIPWAGPILLFISSVGFVTASLSKNLELASQTIAVAAGALIVTIGLPISNAFNLRRSFNRLFYAGHKDRKSYIEINDEQIVRKLSDVSELKIPWNGVVDFVQDETATLIYTNKDCFLLIPTKIMSSIQRAELDSLVARHIAKR